jgi:hypothetical protein
VTNVYTCWDILDHSGKQVGATDRVRMAEAQRRKGFGLLAHQTIVDIDDGVIEVVSSHTTYLPPLEKT